MTPIEIEFDEASQCPLCGDYGGLHNAVCTRGTMNRYRVVFNIGKASGTQFVEATSEAEAITKVALAHERIDIVSCVLERASPLTIEQQRDALLRALRPIYTVCRALLDNPSAAPLFSPIMRAGLETMCADAVAAMKLAGVTK